jgi:hypothetical protein
MKKYFIPIKLYSCLALILISSFVPTKTLAYENNQFYSSNDILFYDANDTSSNCSSSLVGNDNSEKAFRYFVGKGLTSAQAAGIVGNLIKESSGVNPTAIQSSSTLATDSYTPQASVGFGIARWTDSTRQQRLVDYAKSDSSHRTIIDLSLQLDFLWYELGKFYPSALTDLEKQTDPVGATVVFHNEYEGSGDSADTVRTQRGGYATDIYNKYGNNLSSSDSGQCLGGTYLDGFEFYLQDDKTKDWWNKDYYAGGTVGTKGCGLAAMAMIITNLTGKSVTPADTVAYMNDNHGLLEELLPKEYGLNSAKISNSFAAVNDVLNSGGLVIAYNDGGGSNPFYANSSHYVVIRAIAADGKWLIGDSATNQHWTEEYDPTALVGQITYMYGVTK